MLGPFHEVDEAVVTTSAASQLQLTASGAPKAIKQSARF